MGTKRDKYQKLSRFFIIDLLNGKYGVASNCDVGIIKLKIVIEGYDLGFLAKLARDLNSKAYIKRRAELDKIRSRKARMGGCPRPIPKT